MATLNKKRILVTYIEAGFGHITTANSIANAIEALQDPNIEVIRKDIFSEDPTLRKTEKRFIKVYSQGGWSRIMEIWGDTQTGVNYAVGGSANQGTRVGEVFTLEQLVYGTMLASANDMATQMGVARLLPVITARTVAHHINWDRMRKIAAESAEQSNRNSVPEIMPAVKFNELDLSNVVFADERAAYGESTSDFNTDKILIGPEGGFSDEEFSALDAAGARGIGLGKTILRAETAAIVALAKIIK